MKDLGMVSMFQALIASGLEGFLGCPEVVYETALVDFFENASVRDGVIISSVGGQLVEISEKWFAETFELPVDGLSELSEMPKDKIYDARSIVSLSGEPVNLSGRKGQMKIEYRLLCDIMAKSISVKAGSFNAPTVEKFALLTAVVCGIKMNWASVLFNIFKKMVTPGAKQAKGLLVQISLLLEYIPNLNLGESSKFPVSKILTAKMVHRYIYVTDKESTQEAADASPVKQAPKNPGASKKRPVAVPVEAPVVKKKRSLKKKSSSSQSALEMVVVAQEAIPIQTIPATPAVEPMVEDQQAKIVEAHPADEVAPTAGGQEPVVYFSSVNMEDIRNLVGSIALDITALRGEQRSIAQLVVPSVQLSLDQRQSSPISVDSSSSMNFDETDTATTVPAFSLPVSSTVSIDITRALNQLQASLDQISNRDDGAALKDTILMHLRDNEKKFTALFDAQDRWIGALRNDSNDQRTLLSLEIKSSHRQLHTQITAASIDQIDMQREVKELNAKVDAIATNLERVKRDVEATKKLSSTSFSNFKGRLRPIILYLPPSWDY
ncbi:dystroglycan-like [Dorcoceras hygrometricum]|uniref:Dystroglycan-like n=1 Tax=Dorcoceras hygrometricum TaxID=472368 RepID=A0A2Z7B993_9LAMI|nr:dystroglycan-like [Dorcoceras hygrometricum]